MFESLLYRAKQSPLLAGIIGILGILVLSVCGCCSSCWFLGLIAPDTTPRAAVLPTNTLPPPTFTSTAAFPTPPPVIFTPTPHVYGTPLEDLAPDTPTPTYTLAPTYTSTPVIPSSTPTLPSTSTPISVPPTATPSRSDVPMDEEEIVQYLSYKYCSIAGQPLDFEDIIVFDDEDSGGVALELTKESAAVFVMQSEAAITEYGKALLADTKTFFPNKDCGAYVEATWFTETLPDYEPDGDWYYLGNYNPDYGWYVSQTYIMASCLEGQDAVDIWPHQGVDISKSIVETSTEPAIPTATPIPPPPSTTYNCNGDVYNCSDFVTCADAREYLRQCPGDESKLDGNNDGVPCESLCN